MRSVVNSRKWEQRYRNKIQLCRALKVRKKS